MATAPEKESRQLSKLKKIQSKGNSGKYFLLLLTLIALVNIIDEVTSNLTVTVQSSFVTEFFVNNPFMGKYYTFEEGLSFHSTIGVFTYVLGLFTPFYKALADKWGRKPLFVLSTLGMATGLLVINLSSSYIMFLVGFAIISFFMGHDIQIIYILEEAPDKHRAKIYSFLKSFGILGVILIPALRDALMGDDATKWRDIFLVPALLGFAASVLVLFFAKDTKVFIGDRIEYLSRSYEERQAEKALKKQQKQAQRNQAGVFNGVKYIFSNKDTKMLIISHIIFDSAMPAIALYFESSMHSAGMSTSNITKALFMVPVICFNYIPFGLHCRQGRQKSNGYSFLNNLRCRLLPLCCRYPLRLEPLPHRFVCRSLSGFILDRQRLHERYDDRKSSDGYPCIGCRCRGSACNYRSCIRLPRNCYRH